jgi:hypothetical protein
MLTKELLQENNQYGDQKNGVTVSVTFQWALYLRLNKVYM